MHQNIGEFDNPSDDVIHGPVAAHIIMAGICWILLYHILLRPFRVIPDDTKPLGKYYVIGLTPPISYFATWRQYEQCHILFWMGKDLSWIMGWKWSWLACLVPTYVIGIHFLWEALNTRRMTIECTFYLATILWITGNALWAFGELYCGLDDDGVGPIFIFSMSHVSREDLRYWASWALFIAYWPIIILLCIWMPLTYYGKIRPVSLEQCLKDIEEEDEDDNDDVLDAWRSVASNKYEGISEPERNNLLNRSEKEQEKGES